jgi:tetratricopeptide (TPR) repeat protein
MTNGARSEKTELVEFPAALQSAPPPTVSAKARQHFHEGMVHLQSGDASEAVAALSHTVEIEPGFTDARVLLGIAHALMYDIYPAIDQLEEAAKLAPDSFAANFTLAQLNFKLRIPKNGYQAAKKALRCVQTIEHRKMLTQLLKEERERERNGIARPSFDRPFSTFMLFIASGALVAVAIFFVITHVR